MTVVGDHAWLAELFEKLPALVAVVRGPEHVVEFANAPYIDMLGRSAVGRPVGEVLSEAEGGWYLELLDHVYRSGDSVSGIERRVLLKRPGEDTPQERFFDFAFKALSGADGQVTGVLFQGVEVTDRVRARTELEVLNQRLAEAEARYRGLFEGAADAYLVADAEGRYVDANAGATELLGYSREELLGMSVPDVVARAPEWTQREYDRFLQEGNWRGEIELRRRDGAIVAAESVATVIPLGTGTIYVSSLRSVEDRRRAEAAQRSTEERYQRLFREMTHGVVRQDGQGRITEANPSAERILGVTVHQMRGRDSSDPMWRSLREDGSEFRGEEHPAMVALETGQEIRNVAMGVFNPRDERYRWILISSVPERDEAGTVVGVFSIFEDITQRKRIQDERDLLLERETAAKRQVEVTMSELRRLQSITDASLAYLPFEQFSRQLLRRIREELRVDAATLFLLGPDRLHLTAATSVGLEGEADMTPSVPVGEGLVGSVAASGRSLFAQDATSLDPASPGIPEGVASAAAVPLRVDGRTIGAFLVMSWEQRSFTLEDVHLLELVAARIASAVQRAHIHETRDEMGRALQQSLLPPKLPTVPGMELAAGYRPAFTANQVGGDFYDAFDLPDGSWAVVIGDVCGKGPAAAAMMGIVRHSIRAIAQRESRPSVILTMLNQLIMKENLTAYFVTACLLRVVPVESGARVTMTAAGHPLPLLVRGGRAETVGRPGTLLGVFPVELRDTEVDIGHGDTLVLYTDGVVDRRSAEEDGLEVLAGAIREGRHLSADEVSHRIRRVCSENPGDDQAWVVLQPVGSEIPD